METRRRKQISLAQNFLTSPKLVRRLVRMSKIGLSDTVYEIGPGNGIITAALASVGSTPDRHRSSIHSPRATGLSRERTTTSSP